VKQIIIAFKHFIKKTWDDAMLVCILPVPLFAAIVFYFGLPPLEKYLCNYFDKTTILMPYAQLFDLLIICLTSLMFYYVSAMVILDEIDDGTARYYSITPLTKNGYILSRFLVPAIFSFVYSVLLMNFFNISGISFNIVILLCFISIIVCFSVPLIVISLSSNKVEGMALVKLTSLFLIGLPFPFFIHNYIQYVSSFFPSFWFAKIILGEMWAIIPCMILSIIWCMLLYKKFIKKII
jgi:fluoroquinolone transport system permease protein